MAFMMFLFVLGWIGFLTLPQVLAANTALPTVNLGYQIQQASSFNSTGQVYNFSNIRFAQPPLGELRWAPPVFPAHNATVNDGTTYGPICPQAAPAWSAIGTLFAEAFTFGIPFNYTQALAEIAASNVTSTPDGRINEDCLFLDVFVPKTVFDGTINPKPQGKRSSAGAPVLVWIYGGGYTEGSKVSSGVPAGIIKASQVSGSEGVVFVAMNYRLGAFGWQAGPTFSENGTQNVALYDQRFAIEWVQQHVSKFGGDPNRITIIGESAGGGSIFHQITAFGGTKPVPFQQAIMQSAAWLSIPSGWKQEETFQGFLSLLNVSTLEEARQLPSEKLIAANVKQIAANPVYGNFLYGPTAGGKFVPELPQKLLLEGSYAHNLNILVGHNTYEGVYFTNPLELTNETAISSYLSSAYPGIQPSIVNYILKVLYPPIYDGTYPYTTPTLRAILITTESSFSCNSFYMDRAFGNKSYAYQFAVPPAIHGQDIAYTWYNGDGASTPTVNATVALTLQDLVTSFAMTGKPTAPDAGTFSMYGSRNMELDLNSTGIKMIVDPTANVRCEWWQKGLFF